MKDKKIYKTAWQTEAGINCFRLQDGQIVTGEELNKLEQLMPNVCWLIIVFDRGLFPNARAKLDFKNAI